MHSKYHQVAAAGFAVVAVAVAGCKKEPAAAAGPPGGGMPPPLVVAVDALAKNVPEYVDCIGKTVAVESVTITPRIAGQIVERRFEDGAQIKKGQVLFVIDPKPSEAALQSAKAQLASTKAAAALADIELQRYTSVAGTNAISKSDFDTKKNAVDVAQAQVAAAEAAVNTAQINLDFCTIASPIDGRAGARMMDVGNVVKENEASLLSIQKIDPIYADFTVNEQQLVAVRQNMADGTLKTIVRLPTDSGDGRVGELTFLDNAVQDATGTIRLRATIQNQDAHFWPGQFVGVRLILKTLEGAVLVPSSAQQMSQKGPFVFVVKPDSTAEMRPVTVGQSQSDMIVITTGLKAGEKVITDGQMMVRPGTPVRVGPSTAASQPTGGSHDGGAPGTGIASSSSSNDALPTATTKPTASAGDGSVSAGTAGAMNASATQGGSSDAAPSGEASKQAGAPAGASQGGTTVQPGKGGNEAGR